MAVRRIDHEDVHICRDQRVGAIQRVLGDADRRAAAQAAERVLRRVRILHRLLNVLDGNEPLQPVVVIDDEELFDLVFVQDRARGVERRADGHREQRLVRHHVGDWTVHVGLEPEIPVRQDPAEPAFLAAVFGDRDARDPVLPHQIERFVDSVGGGQRDRIDDHPAL